MKARWLAESERKGELEISVTDSGSGIRDTQRIWQLFEQEDDGLTRSQQGSGLGLAIVRNLVQLLSGTIQVDSEMGEGSCFTVCLPMTVHMGNAPSDEELSELPLPELRKHRVLVVDDNNINQMIVTEMLLSLGQAVESVTSGPKALQALQRSSFDAVFMDLHMPGMDGMETTQQIRQDGSIKQPYIIALTANAFPETRTQALRSGMDDYVTKPFVKEDLARVLNRINVKTQRKKHGI